MARLIPAFGDQVSYVLPDMLHKGCGFVVGTMKYERNGKGERSVIAIADEHYTGMPINEVHCTVLTRGHASRCDRLRKRYAERIDKTVDQVFLPEH